MTEHAVVACANEDNDTRYLSYLLSTIWTRQGGGAGVADDGTGACGAGVLAAMAFCRKRCFLNISLRSVCVGTVTFSFSVGFDADWVLPCKVRFFRFSCIARNLR